jgi:hypothetical protein
MPSNQPSSGRPHRSSGRDRTRTRTADREQRHSSQQPSSRPRTRTTSNNSPAGLPFAPPDPFADLHAPGFAYNGAQRSPFPQEYQVYPSLSYNGGIDPAALSSVTLVAGKSEDEQHLLAPSKSLQDIQAEEAFGHRTPLVGHGGTTPRQRHRSGPGGLGESWERRQTLPRRGPTRKVKLTHGKNFVVEYAVPTAVRNAVEGKWLGGERGRHSSSISSISLTLCDVVGFVRGQVDRVFVSLTKRDRAGIVY